MGPAHSVSGVCVTVIRQDPTGPFFSGGSVPAARARGGRWEEAESAQLPQPHSRFGHRRTKEPPASTDDDGRKEQFAWCCQAVRSFKTVLWMWMRGQSLRRLLASVRASLVGFLAAVWSQKRGQHQRGRAEEKRRESD